MRNACMRTGCTCPGPDRCLITAVAAAVTFLLGSVLARSSQSPLSSGTRWIVDSLVTPQDSSVRPSSCRTPL